MADFQDAPRNNLRQISIYLHLIYKSTPVEGKTKARRHAPKSARTLESHAAHWSYSAAPLRAAQRPYEPNVALCTDISSETDRLLVGWRKADFVSQMGEGLVVHASCKHAPKEG